MVYKKLMLPGVDEQITEDKPALEELSGEISATGRCMEAKLNLLAGFAKILTQPSLKAAPHLAVSEQLRIEEEKGCDMIKR